MPKPRGGVRTWAKPGGGGVGCGSGGCDTSEHDDEHEEPSPLSDCSPVGPPALMPGGPDVGPSASMPGGPVGPLSSLVSPSPKLCDDGGCSTACLAVRLALLLMSSGITRICAASSITCKGRTTDGPRSLKRCTTNRNSCKRSMCDCSMAQECLQ